MSVIDCLVVECLTADHKEREDQTVNIKHKLKCIVSNQKIKVCSLLANALFALMRSCLYTFSANAALAARIIL